MDELPLSPEEMPGTPEHYELQEELREFFESRDLERYLDNDA